MKISLKNFFLCAVAAVGLSAASNVSAVTVIGELDFSGGANLDPNTINDAEQITNFFIKPGAVQIDNTASITRAEGIFSSVSGTLTALPLDFDTFVNPFLVYTNPITLETYEFNFVSLSSDTLEPGRLTLTGTGNLTDDEDNILYSALFSLTSQQIQIPGVDPSGNVSYSATITVLEQESVPEGGSAVLLLGLGMVGAETLRRRLVKNRA